MKAIVLTFDRLALHLLGCYGSSWVETPHLDRLAAGAVVFDRHYAENLDPAAESHAWWSGCRQLPPPGRRQGGGVDLPQLFQQSDVALHLLVEDGARQPAWKADGLASLDEVSGDEGLEAEADEIPFARLVATAVDRLAELDEFTDQPWLLWLASRGVPSPWLAPRDWATLYLDLEETEDEPEPSEEIDEEDEAALEDELLPGEIDQTEPGGSLVDFSPEEFEALLRAVSCFGLPDSMGAEATETEWRIARQVYAGYVSLLDRWLGRLLDEIDRRFIDDRPLLIVTAAEGDPLGHRLGLPGNSTRVGEETSHTPLIIRVAGESSGSRRQELVQTIDLAPTLLDWFGIEAGRPMDGNSLLPLIRGPVDSWRNELCVGDGARAVVLRTREYSFVRTTPGKSEHEPRQQLFAQPDDPWEIHDIAGQSPEIGETLAAKLARKVEG